MGFGLHLRHVDDANRGLDPRQSQFGIRELMIITALVGVVFGIGRLVVTNMGERFVLSPGELPFLIVLAVTAILLTLPLLLAALMRRMTLPGVLLALVLIGVVSFWERPLSQGLYSGLRPEASYFVAVNAFTAATILTVAVVVRLNGYSLATVGSGTIGEERRDSGLGT